MLFNSYAFIFLYLPLVLLGFFAIARIHQAWAAAWLALASLFFYGYWNPIYVGLLMASIVCNYGFGTWLGKAVAQRKRILTLAVSADLLLLGYYKYANFFVDSVNTVSGSDWQVGNIILPLGISFFTFTQIAFLVDTYQGKVKEFNFIHYTLFVTYFPHLIAGPVLHHKEMMPQFALPATYRFNPENMAVGLTIFFIGLFKKVILADGLAEYVGPVFAAHGAGMQLSFIDAWGGALCYTLQLYFDFSGYSDMAIGLSRLFGVTLPLNFHSPYKSVNIVEFWRRWHMTLSRFLRDYLYIPAGRQPQEQGASLYESDGDHVARRLVARRGLDLRVVGRLARPLSDHQPRLAWPASPHGARPQGPTLQAHACLGGVVHLRRSGSGLGVVPRREPRQCGRDLASHVGMERHRIAGCLVGEMG